MNEHDATASPLTRLCATVCGRVQGVGFRMFVVDEAQRLELTGRVRNCFDGTVEVIAEGPREDLDQLVRELHRGSPLARVQRVDVQWRAATGEYTSFDDS